MIIPGLRGWGHPVTDDESHLYELRMPHTNREYMSHRSPGGPESNGSQSRCLPERRIRFPTLSRHRAACPRNLNLLMGTATFPDSIATPDAITLRALSVDSRPTMLL